MKIAYLSSSIIPSKAANSVHVMKMCSAFAENGNQVTLFSRNGSEELSNDFKHYGVKQNFELKKVKYFKLKSVNVLWTSYKYNNLLKEGNLPNLIYGRDILNILIAQRLNIPTIFESHEPPKDKFKYLLQRRLFKSHSFKKLVVISEALKIEYLKIFDFLSEDKIFVAHDGADIINYENQNSNFKTGTFNAGYVGSLYEGRGIDIIIEMAKALPDVTFHIIGGTNEEVVKWKGRSNSSNIIFYGHVPPSQVQQYHINMDVLLAPYQEVVRVGNNKGDTSKWMSPLKLFEYMAAGRPIIVSDLPVLHEVLDDTTAIFVNPINVDNWIENLIKLKGNHDLRKALGNNSLDLFLKEYTWHARAQKVLAGI